MKSTIPSAHLVFKDRCLPWEAHEFKPHWSFLSRKVPRAMAPEKARAMLRGTVQPVHEPLIPCDAWRLVVDGEVSNVFRIDAPDRPGLWTRPRYRYADGATKQFASEILWVK